MAVDFKDYYRILGVDRKADDKTIKSAYRRLARKHHPDVAKTKDATERFKEISEAYEVLSDPEKRRRYDSLGPDWQRYTQAPPGGPGGGFRVEYGGDDLGNLGDFSEFFRTIFGDPGAQARRGARGGGMRVGDLYLSVTVASHPFFERKGDDVHLTLPITASEAALGTTLEVPTLRGKVSMKVPPATSSGRTFRLPGYGMPRLKGAGDQLVAVKIVMPSDVTPAERELYEKLRALRSDNPRAYLG